MTTTHGFTLIEQRDIPELKTHARLYRHDKTGAQLLSLVNDDENKVFGVTFRTPPADSTGVAHILEHSVLCGSRKYPVKEPFVELLKGSLKTFLNAFTYPDKTCYPVASQNVTDFYNLIDVYLDAVFYPRLTPEVLMQEGWHFEADSPDGPLTYQGVVYGEMKGVRSSPDSLLAEYTQNSLFPDTTYGLDSGGDPKHIPELTFEAFEAFHKRNYHPSNARFFFHGDDDPDERLRIINEYLKDFDKREVDSSVALQSRFSEPRRIEKAYPGTADSKSMITVNWLMPETAQVELNYALHVMEYALVGMPASPLRKALIDSGLGEDVAGAGLETDLRQMYFSVGMKGVQADNLDKVQALIIDTLERLATEGIDRGLIEAAVNTIEFRMREANTGSYPRGLVFMLTALTTWLYDADPFALLAFEKPFEAVKQRALSDSSYISGLIREHILGNPHRTTVVLKPDLELSKRQDEEEKQRAMQAQSTLGSQGLQQVIEQARVLKQKQQAADAPEALACIPKLSVADLPRQARRIPCEPLRDRTGDAPLFVHDLPTFGIVYLDVGFDLTMVPPAELPLVPLFSRALLETGTVKEDFVSLSQRISANTGGIWPDALVSAISGSAESTGWLFLRGKAMVPKAPELTSILRDVLLGARIDDRQRFRQLVLEQKARQERRLVPSGHSIVDMRLRANFHPSDWISEQMYGISNLFFLRRLVEEVDRNWDGVALRLRKIQEMLINRRTMVINVTQDASSFGQVKPHLDALLDSIPVAVPKEAHWKGRNEGHREGLTIPAQVNYVGKAANLYDLGYQFHGSSLVISRFLRTSWLWDRIRVQGGAYGAFSRFDRLTGVFSLLSYRDPNLERTIESFDATAKFLREVPLPKEEIDKSIIGTIGDLDAYMLPDAKGYVSMVRTLTRQTDEERDKIREQVFETSEKHFRQFAEVLEAVKNKGIITVLGSAEAVGKAALSLGLEVKEVL